MDPFLHLIKRLTDHGVRFVLIGGYAAALHGSDLMTQDLDVCASMDEENLARIIAALRGLNPTFRFHVKTIPLHDDPKSLFGVKNLYLRTDLALLDILGEVSGLGGYAELEARSNVHQIHEVSFRLIDLDALITAKKAAGRPKDQLAVMHLEAIRRLQRPDELT